MCDLETVVCVNQTQINYISFFFVGINRVTLLGRMGKDPEFRGTKEHPVVVFPLATNKSYRKSTGKRKIAHHHNNTRASQQVMPILLWPPNVFDIKIRKFALL